MAKITNGKRQKDSKPKRQPGLETRRRREYGTDYYTTKYSERDDYYIVRVDNSLPRWEDLIPLDTIECGGIEFRVDDEIDVKVENQKEPSQCLIRSMRQYQAPDGTLEFLNVLWKYTQSEAKQYISTKQAQIYLGQNDTIVTNHADIILITEVIRKSPTSNCTLPDQVLDTKRRRILPRRDRRVAWLFRNDGAATNKATAKRLESVTPADTSPENQREISSSDSESEDSAMTTDTATTEKQLVPVTPADTVPEKQREIPPSDSELSEDSDSDSTDSDAQREASPPLGDGSHAQDDDDIDAESSQPEAPSPTANSRKHPRDDGEEVASKGDVRDLLVPLQYMYHRDRSG